MDPAQKKLKSPNFKPCELNILSERVLANADVVRSKFSNEVTNIARKTFWEETTKALLMASGVRRSTSQVMDKWNHWSSDVVRRERQRVRECSRTGGGLPSSTWVPSPSEERVLNVMGRTVIHGVPVSGGEVGTPSSPALADEATMNSGIGDERPTAATNVKKRKERPSDDQLLDVEKRKIEIEEEKLYVFKEILMEIRGLRADMNTQKESGNESHLTELQPVPHFGNFSNNSYTNSW